MKNQNLLNLVFASTVTCLTKTALIDPDWVITLANGSALCVRALINL